MFKNFARIMVNFPALSPASLLRTLMHLINLTMLNRCTLSIERNHFPAKNQPLKILQSIYFAYEVGIISSAKCMKN